MSAQEPRTPLRLSQTEQRTHPGWTRLEWKAADGHQQKTEFRGPGGEIISRRQFSARVKSGEIPTVDPASGDVKPPAATVQTLSDPPSLAAASPTRRAAGGDVGEAAAPTFERSFDLPTAEAATRRASPGQASPAELALTAQIGLIILTSLLAFLTRTPELAISEIEAQAIGTPLANIFAKSELNRRFGRYLADSSDYTLLGYALYAYGFRVANQLAAHTQAEAAAQGTQRGFPHVVQTAQAPGAAPAAQPVPGPAASAGAGAGERTGPASGGIGGAVRGALTDQSARVVGFNPIPFAGGA